MENPKILIVEDEILIARAFEQTLCNLGYIVTSVATNGKDAIRLAESDEPDLILMDIRLPGGMDGIETAEIISSQFNIPVIFITSFSDKSLLEKAKLIHPYGYLTKPVQENTLKTSIGIALHTSNIDKRRRVRQVSTEQAFEESEQRFRETADLLPGPIIETNEELMITYMNQAGFELFGYTARDIDDGLRGFDLFHPSELEKVQQNIADLCHRKAKIEPIEYRIRTKDESYVPVLGKTGLILKDDEIGGFRCVFTDISNQKKIERELQINLAEKETLLQEIHHRVKNTLQVLSSLIGMQVLRSEDKQLIDVLNEFQNRIKAMSIVHEQIYQSELLNEIELHKYIKNLISNLNQTIDTNTDSIAIHYSLEPLSINLKRCISIGLIITELFTNAVKHAFAETEDPKIRITLSKEGDNCVLYFCDNGIGLPEDLSLEKVNTLGLKIVRMFSKQLDAHYEFYGDTGTEFKIVFEI